MKFTELEKKLLKEFAKQHNACIQSEEEFLAKLVIQSRKYTGCGFFTYFKTGGKLQIGDDKAKFVGGGLGAKLNQNIDTGYCFFVEEGYLDMLEGYCYGEQEWPENITTIEIYDIPIQKG